MLILYHTLETIPTNWLNRMPSTVKLKYPVLIIAALLLLLPSNVRAAEALQKTLSLPECIQIALKNATSVQKASNSQHLEGIDVLRSYGSFLPKVASSSSYVPRSVNRSYSLDTQTGTDLIKTKTDTATLGFTLSTSLNLFNGLSDYSALQSALRLRNASGFTLERARQAVVYDVTQSYYQVLLNQELLSIARENLQSARDLFTLVDRQYKIGLKSVIDLYQQEAEVSNNELNAIKADNQLRRSKLELLRRLRIDPLSEITPLPVDTASLESLSPDLDLRTLADLSIRNRADLRAKQLESDAARWQVRTARGSRLPKLDLAVSMSTNAIDAYKLSSYGQTFDFPLPPAGMQLQNGVDYSVAFNLTWTLFDGFMTRYNVESAKVAHLNQKLDYEELKDGIVIDLKQAAGDYRAAFGQIASARATLTAAGSAYSGVLRKYELGASGFVELSTARATLFNAKSTLTQAVYNLALQRALLDFTTGKNSFQ